MTTSVLAIEEPTYFGIAEYYDNRKAAVTITADDWENQWWQEFEDMSTMFTEKHLYFTGAISTNLDVNWTQIQYWLDQGYLEAAAHSRTHKHLSEYDEADYDWEIGGSKNDIIGNLTLPPSFSSGSMEYVYSWIEPYGESDNTTRQKLGFYKYLTDRRTSSNIINWSTWNSTDELFDRIGYTIRIGSDGTEEITTLNSKFDDAYDAGGIYHLMSHPRNVNWTQGQYADSHTDYISNRYDVWYVTFGHLYLYRWIATQNVVQITSTGSGQDKVFKINMSSTDHQNYGAKYPVTYVFDIPSSWTNGYVNYRFRETDPWITMEAKNSSDFFNGINATRFDFSNHKVYVSIGFDDASNEIYLKILTKPTADFTASPTSGHAPLTVSFTDLSSSYDGITAWEWDFDNDGVIDSTEQNPVHIYEEEGVYTVSLTVFEADGDNDTETKIDYIDVMSPNQPPIADANGPYAGIEGETIAFDSSGSYDPDGVIVSYLWDFGDGQTSTEQNPTHTYAQEGTYIVTLTVTDDDLATNTSDTTATVEDTGPTADFSATPTSGDEPLSVSFTDLSSSYDGITAWEWDFDNDGVIDSTEQNPIYMYDQDDVYTATLKVYESDGNYDIETKVDYVTVTDKEPNADFSATPTSGVEPLQVNFTDNSTSYDGIVSLAWDFGDGNTSIEQNPTHTYTQDGTYTVTLTVYEGDGNSATETKTDYIIVSDTDPIADFTASPTSGPEPLTVSFTDNSTSYDRIISWNWSFGDGETSTEQNPIHTYANAGVYKVSLTVLEADGDNKTKTKSDYIVVDDSVPTASFTYSPLNPLEDNLITFNASSSTGYDKPLSYSWDFGDGSTTTVTEPLIIHTYAQDGDYIVRLTVVDSDGSTDSTSLTIKVADKDPIPDFNASPTNGTEPLQVNFEDNSTSYDGINGWTWNFGDGQSSTEQNPTHTYVANGTYTVILTVVEGDGDSAVKIKEAFITIMDTSPTADFTASQTSEALTINFTDTSTSYDKIESWAWDFGDGETSMDQNPIHKFPDDGVFNVTLIVTDADGSTDTITKQVSVLNVGPTADFNIVSSPKPTIDEDITFLDQSSDPDGYIVSWFWDLGDGTTSTSQNVIHKYYTIGTFIVNLTVTDDDGKTGTTSNSITIYDVVPPVTVDNYDGLWHTSDFTINLTATDDLSGVQTTYYRINDGPLLSVQVDGQPFIFIEGYNKLEYWSVDLAGNEEAHQIIPDVKLDKTNPTADAGPDQAVDEDALMTFDGSASYDNIGITSYTWTFLDGAPQTLTGMNLTYTFNTPGNYTVILSVSDAALNSATDTVVITVIDITKPVANAGDDQVVHEDTTVTFDGSGSTDNVEIVSYIWTFIDVTPQTLLGVNSTYIFDIPGVYNVTLTVSDAQGNLATDVVTITVIDATWPAANAGPDQVVDEDTLVNFEGSDSSDNVGIISYVWTFIDGTLQTLFGVNPRYTFETPGVYTVTLNVTDAEGHFTTDTVVITVQDITPPLIDAGSYTTVVEKAPVNFDASESSDNVGIVSYKWDFGDGTFENSNISSAIYTYTKPGVYMVTLTVVDEAGNVNSTSISVVVYRDTDGDLISDFKDTDDDNDGMPDDWEILHGLNPLDSSDASLDSDGDSLSNLTEYQIDSDPNVYTSPSPFPLVGVLVIVIIGFVIFLGVLFMRKL